MPLLASIADELVALEAGSQIAAGAPAQVLSDPLVVASYLGQDRSVVHRSGSGAPPGDTSGEESA
jgi:ABC-type hemin transport system ATPase subunit